MASGVAAVLSAIPSFLAFDAHRDYAVFADEDDYAGLGEGLLRLLTDEPLRRHTALRGREVVEQFRADTTGARLERYLHQRVRH
jgi:glycosyltransferase involved in cell wall biosynthesis